MKDTKQVSTEKPTRKPAARRTATAIATGGTATKPARKRTSPSTPTATRMPSYDEIALRARSLYEQSGHTPGRDEEFWLEAERQLREELAR